MSQRKAYGEVNKDEEESTFWLGQLLVAVQVLLKCCTPTNYVPLHFTIFQE